MHCVVAVVASSASTTDDGTARRRYVAASSHWLALCRLSSIIRFLIYLEFHQHSRLYTTLYICDSKYTFIAIIVSCEVVELQP